jgi:hypothetical protein
VRGLRELWRRTGFGRLLTARLSSLAGAAAVAALLSAGVYIGSSLVAAGFATEALRPDHSVRRAAAPASRALARVLRNLVEGARYAARRRPVAAGLTAIGLHRFSYGISTIATLLLAFVAAGYLAAAVGYAWTTRPAATALP